jgi:hypothetical protein
LIPISTLFQHQSIMPTRKAPQVPPQPGDDHDDTASNGSDWQLPVTMTPDEAAEESAGDQLRAVFAAAPGENMRVSLYRRDTKTRALQWCEDFTPPQVESGAHELIRDSWGAGMYELRAIGKTGIKARVQIEIAQKPQVTQTNPAPQNDQLAQVLAMLAQGQQRIMEALTQRPEPVAPPTMKEVLEQMVLMKTVLAPAPAPAVAPGQSQSEMLRDMVQTMKTLREVSEDVSPKNEADPENPMSMLPSLIDLVKTGMQSRSQPALQTPQQITVPQSIAHSGAEQTLNTEPHTGNDSMIAMILRGASDELIRLAASGESPENGGDFIYRSLPDDLVPMLALPNWFEIVAHHAPALAEHRAWVEQAKAHADTLFHDTGSAGDTPG